MTNHRTCGGLQKRMSLDSEQAMSEDGRDALAEELSTLGPGTELRPSFEDFDLLFPPELYGPAPHQTGRPAQWCLDLAKRYGCVVRSDEDLNVIAFKKIGMRLVAGAR